MLVIGDPMRPRAFGVLLLLAPSLAIPALIVVMFALLDHFFAVMLLLILWPVWALSAVTSAWCGYRIWKRGWWPGVLALLLPAAMLLNPSGVFRAPPYIGDVIRFWAMKPSYDRHVAELSRDHYSRIPEFYWGGMTFASDGVAYDETDEIALPKERRSAEWQAREKDTDLLCGGTDLVGGVQPLWGHYYLANFGC